MNHLAHVFLAPDSPEARVGSILGDFTRGVDLSALQVFSRQRRRFAGVALDILYDHFLLKHWDRFSEIEQEAFIRRIYNELQQKEHLMPDKMARVTRMMVWNDWFGAYQDLENIGKALDRVAGRIRFRNDFAGMITEIRANHEELEHNFLSFFPDLQEFAGGIE